MRMTERVILIDDNDADNEFHEIVLREAGFTGEVRTFELAGHALDALPELFKDERSTLILLDINMPRMDGWQFVRHATPLLEGRPLLLVVMLTSSATEEERRRARALPLIRGFLTKPLDPEMARRLLTRAWP
jgi:CheY-like chemotaxis protein